MKPHAISINRSITKDKVSFVFFFVFILFFFHSVSKLMSRWMNRRRKKNRNETTKIIFIDCRAHILHRISLISMIAFLWCVFFCVEAHTHTPSKHNFRQSNKQTKKWDKQIFVSSNLFVILPLISGNGSVSFVKFFRFSDWFWRPQLVATVNLWSQNWFLIESHKKWSLIYQESHSKTNVNHFNRHYLILVCIQRMVFFSVFFSVDFFWFFWMSG